MTEPNGEAVAPDKPHHIEKLLLRCGFDEGWQRIALLALLVLLLTLIMLGWLAYRMPVVRELAVRGLGSLGPRSVPRLLRSLTDAPARPRFPVFHCARSN